VTERVLDADAVEVPAGDGEELAVRPLPERRSKDELGAWRGEVRAIAVVAAGGIACGAATVAALTAARSRSARRRPSRSLRRTDRGDSILASRSFLVDVHVLGR
jgi:hypothetical protein